jgi:hypothetical protein
MSSILQEGIYWDEKTRPGKFFCLLFLIANRNSTAMTIGQHFSGLWDMYSDLKKGIVRDLPGHNIPDSPDVPGHANLKVLVGYGQNIFDEKEKIEGIKKKIPTDLKNHSLGKPDSVGGGKILKAGGLSYSSDIFRNYATEDIAIQFIADTQLAVNRCVLETWKFLYDENKKKGKSPISLGHFFSGFQREDGRSMLDFHDGLSNMVAGKQRYKAIYIKNQPLEEDKWTENGTYLAFFRIAVDLGIWREISRSKQETIIGRDKLSGCPIVNIDPNGNPISKSGCPVEGTTEVIQDGNERFHDIDFFEFDNPELTQSHIKRANFLRSNDTAQESSVRIYRQGYEFLEQINEQPRFRWGLNFISFQDTPSRLFRMLETPGWLGNTNFGGNPNSPGEGVTEPPLPGMERLISVRAAGIYLVPPLSETEKFPGSVLFF